MWQRKCAGNMRAVTPRNTNNRHRPALAMRHLRHMPRTAQRHLRNTIVTPRLRWHTGALPTSVCAMRPARQLHAYGAPLIWLLLNSPATPDGGMLSCLCLGWGQRATALRHTNDAASWQRFGPLQQ